MDFRKTNSTVLQHILNAKPLKYGNEIVLFLYYKYHTTINYLSNSVLTNTDMNQIKAGAALNYVIIALNTIVGLLYTPLYATMFRSK